MTTKQKVREHWETETAAIRYGEGTEAEEFYRSIEERRYALEPFIPSFAQFGQYAARPVLEIGMGGGVDFSQFVHHGAKAVGVDLTQAGIRHTVSRIGALHSEKNNYHLAQADAENLPFQDNTFELIYSWGVLHHTPDTEGAFGEAFRVLKPGGFLKVMIYHLPSWTCWMLWLRHAFLKGKPLASPRRCAFEYLESPGTKVYTVAEAKRMFEELGFIHTQIRTELGPSDLMNIKLSERYQGMKYRLVSQLYPRWVIRLLGNRFGLYMLINAQKPPGAARR